MTGEQTLVDSRRDMQGCYLRNNFRRRCRHEEGSTSAVELESAGTCFLVWQIINK